MPRALFAALLTLAACGGTKPPVPEAAPPPPAAAMTPEDCTGQGGQVKGDIGDGKVACAAEERDLGRVSQGIEGAVCCAPAAPAL